MEGSGGSCQRGPGTDRARGRGRDEAGGGEIRRVRSGRQGSPDTSVVIRVRALNRQPCSRTGPHSPTYWSCATPWPCPATTTTPLRDALDKHDGDTAVDAGAGAVPLTVLLDRAMGTFHRPPRAYPTELFAPCRAPRPPAPSGSGSCGAHAGTRPFRIPSDEQGRVPGDRGPNAAGQAQGPPVSGDHPGNGPWTPLLPGRGSGEGACVRVRKQGGGHLQADSSASMTEEFGPDSAPEGFHQCVVRTVADRACRGHQPAGSGVFGAAPGAELPS
jgi:hypothetical protein